MYTRINLNDPENIFKHNFTDYKISESLAKIGSGSI